ncbi:peptide chain release factor 2 [Candidatus Uhrbacteria bacterium]|nr:peptide chain release factor 2 [Candidatus Uhrbacteria bacterium]
MADIVSRIQELEGKIKQLEQTLRIEEKKASIIELEHEMQQEDFWTDRVRATLQQRTLSRLNETVSVWEQLAADARDIEELASAGGDTKFDQELEQSMARLRKRFEALEFQTLLSGTHDSANALCAIHAGTGGVDAMDWAEILLRMYLRFCERMGWRVRIIDKLPGAEAGIKSATFEVIGSYAYGYLKAENGVHRLVRISPFDAEKMRHTSFALFEVIPDLGEVSQIQIKPEDIKIDVFRAGGHGGQSVNTTDSAVRVTHLATGIVVTCQNERSQLQNKETALRYLAGKLHKLEEEKMESEKKKLRGEYSEAAWGNQIRSYVINPYKLVKDHRTNHETSSVTDVLDGDLLPFIEEYLRATVKA